MKNKDLIKNDNKILFQINYDVEEDTYKYIVNEMTNQEFLAFLMFLRLCINQFEDKTFEECFKNDL
jgi:hypothetical protein